MKIVPAVSGVPIRLTPERWTHVAIRHPEMAGQEGRVLGTIAAPDYVQEGDHGTLLAVKHYASTPLTSKHCVVVYREVAADDGFVVTAYFASRPAAWRNVVWKP